MKRRSIGRLYVCFALGVTLLGWTSMSFGQAVIGDDIADFFYDPADGAMWMFTDQTPQLSNVILEGPQPPKVDYWNTTEMIYFSGKMQWSRPFEDHAGPLGDNRLVRLATYDPGLDASAFGLVETGLWVQGTQFRPVSIGPVLTDLPAPTDPIVELPPPPPPISVVAEPELTFPNLERFAPATGKYRFSSSIAVKDGRTFIGASNDSTLADDAGAVYVYQRDDMGRWSLETRIDPPVPSIRRRFGTSVHTDGLSMAVSEGGSATLEGSASVYRQDETGEWAEVTRILPPSGARRSGFGRQVLIDQDTLVVGAPLYDTMELDSVGGAWVYREGPNGQFLQEAQLTVSPEFGANDGDWLASSMAIDDGTVLLGAPRDDSLGPESGAVYVYSRGANDQWQLDQKIIAANGQAKDLFGSSVTITGNVAVVGAPGAHANGFAYVFERNDVGQWQETATLWADEPLFGDQFGSSVSIDGDRLLVGAEHSGNNGVVYIFERAELGEWALREKLGNDNERYGAEFGTQVALDGNSMIVASPHELSGRVYLYEAAIPGDASLDGSVDDADFAIWAENGFSEQDDFRLGDFDQNGVVDGSDFNMWLTHQSAPLGETSPVPEPSSFVCLLSMLMTLCTRRYRDL